MDHRMGDNINGPSLIRAPAWAPNPLGRYYLYFAHHEGGYIRLAYADAATGPWRIHTPGALDLAETPCDEHIASPDVHVIDETREIRLYFHGCFKTDSPRLALARQQAAAVGGADFSRRQQFSYVATSTDGLNFTVRPTALGLPYWRAFRWANMWYVLSMPGQLYRSVDGLNDFEAGPAPFRNTMRHSAVRLVGHTLTVVYSNIGDAPEHLLVATMDLTGDWSTWRPTEPVSLLEPATIDEGVDLPIEPSRNGAFYGRIRQLRDPAFFEEAGRLYLLYSIAGESGIAVAECR